MRVGATMMLGQECLSFDMTPRMFKILTTLIKANGQPVHIKRLVDSVYGDDPDGGPMYPEPVIKHGITDLKYHVWAKGYDIRTVRGFGYQIVRMS